MPIELRQYAEMMDSALSAVATRSGVPLALEPGSVVRAVLEAALLQDLYLQVLLLQVQAAGRASTATGADLDSYFGDFDFPRLPATYDVGQATFSRFTANGSSPTVPVGATIQSNAGQIAYAVLADPSNPDYDEALAGYPLPPDGTTVTATIQAVEPGSLSNVIAGILTVLTSAIPGVDEVVNLQPINNARDAETDTAYRARFVQFLNSLSKATAGAIDAAIEKVQQGLSWVKLENQTPDGAPRPGFFSVVAEDGSGALPTVTHDAISAAVEDVRPFTVGFGVFAPSIVEVSVSMTALLASNADEEKVRSNIRNAIASYLLGRGISGTVYFSRVVQLAIDASPDVIAVENVSLNGAPADVVIGPTQIARPGQILIG
ncbi:baseplate J/gp47 family protein [bacterium]|nr:baseplate J/gp47 family protein [bacterium]